MATPESNANDPMPTPHRWNRTVRSSQLDETIPLRTADDPPAIALDDDGSWHDEETVKLRR